MERYSHAIDPHRFVADFFAPGPPAGGQAQPPTGRQIAAYQLSRGLTEGHICLDITGYNESCADNAREVRPNLRPLYAPIDIEKLRDDPLTVVIPPAAAAGGPAEPSPPDSKVSPTTVPAAPFVIDGRRIYMQRYYVHETGILTNIKRLTAPPDERQRTADTLRPHLDFLRAQFPGIAAGQTERQLAAVLNSAVNRFSMITGGPGTGKTYTVAKLLALLLTLTPGCRAVMTAPTGKAASRLGDSLTTALHDENHGVHVDDTLRGTLSGIPCQTLHSLLGVRPYTLDLRHHRDHPLPYDIIIVDEASMIDVSLMSRMFDAVPDNARLVLLGDRNQLASVEAGSVFGDLCRSCGPGLSRLTDEVRPLYEAAAGHPPTEDPLSAAAAPPLSATACELTVSRRFSDREGIGRFSRAVIAGTPEIIDDDEFRRGDGAVTVCVDDNAVDYLTPFQEYLTAEDTADALAALERFRVLTARRSGPRSVEELNREIERGLGLNPEDDMYYHNQPLMVRQNRPRLDIYNGDTGLVRRDNDGRLMLYRRERPPIPAAVLPLCETAFALTVHKSQGSDYDTVLIYLPDTAGRLLSRELLYTAVTRARRRAIIAGDADVLKNAIQNRVRRASGIQERLAARGDA
jgi:exodeoxyribonuclease V alpha subunit